MVKRKKPNQGRAVFLTVVSLFALGLIMAALLQGKDLVLFNPKGLIAEEEHRLMVLSTLIMSAFAAAVLAVLYFFAWRFRETNNKSEYRATAGRSKIVLAVAWVAPVSVFIILAWLMLPATQKLEPNRAIESDAERMTIRVIATRWKWVFMYPEHNIATVNYVQIPVDTPVRFELTADEAPMNSFWIPHLGGMLYAMTEHVNHLNLIAHDVGDYTGGAAEINGRGFAGMRFTTRVSSVADFDTWWRDVAASEQILSPTEYDKLTEPSENNPVSLYYSPENREIFATVLKKYASGSHSHYPDNTEHEAH